MNLACRSRALLAVLLAVPSLVLLAPPARAQLSSPAPESCTVSPDALPQVADAADPPAVEVVVSGEPGRWLATLRVRYASGSAGTRRITARSCAELQRAVAVTLSLLDAVSPAAGPAVANGSPTATAEASAVATGPAPSDSLSSSAVEQPNSVVEQPSAVPTSAAPLPLLPVPSRAAAGEQDGGGVEPPRAAPRPLQGFLRASSLVAIAGGRFGELGAALASGAWLGAWGARVELSARRPLAKLTADHDFTLQLARYAAALEPCVRTLGTLELALCGGPRLELLRGLAIGPSQPASDLVWLPGVGGGSWLRLPVSSSWSLSAGLQASWGLRRAQASVAPWGKVYELPRFGTGLLLGAEWAL